MRCDEVSRALSAPVVGLDRSALSDHLAACDRCSHDAEASDRLLSLWSATRADEPGPEVFDRIWGAASEAAAAPQTLRFADFGRRAMTYAAIAQAAAILIAGAIALRKAAPAPEAEVTPSVRVMTVALEEGTTGFLTLSGGSAPSFAARQQESLSETDMVPVDWDVLNYLESFDKETFE